MSKSFFADCYNYYRPHLKVQDSEGAELLLLQYTFWRFAPEQLKSVQQYMFLGQPASRPQARAADQPAAKLLCLVARFWCIILVAHVCPTPDGAREEHTTSHVQRGPICMESNCLHSALDSGLALLVC